MSSIVPPLADRRALRALAERPVDQATVRRLFEAAILAPSCANKQPWRFEVIQQPTMLDGVRGLLTEGNYWAKKAPLVVAAWTHLDFDVRNPDGRDFALFDLGQAVMALQVQAQAEGLIAHPIAGFNMPETRTLLGLPEGSQILVLIPVGYPGSADHLSEKHRESEVSPRSRKPLDEVVRFR